MKVVRNYLYNASYQLLTILLPIITVPIISRALGSKGVGIFAYTNSIILEVTLIGTLGIANYAVRQIAYVRDDREKLNHEFSNIFFLQCCFCAMTLLIFLGGLFLSGSQYQSLFLIQTLYLISAAMDSSWLFIGLENFKKIVVRNAEVKIIGLALILVFVRRPQDVFLYTAILSVTQFLGQLTMFIHFSRYVDWRRPSLVKMRAIFLPVLVMFIPQVANQVYTVLNKTILGLFQDQNEVGYFDMADKISRIALQLMIAVAAVMYPKISNLYAQKRDDLIEKYLNLSVQIVHVIALPMVAGLIACSPWLVPWFLGRTFTPTTAVLQIMSLLIWIVPFGAVLQNQFLLPTRHVRMVTIAVLCGAVVSLILNGLFIPQFAAIGAAITSVVAEAVFVIVNLFFVRKFLAVRSMFQQLPIYLFNTVIMFLVVMLIGLKMNAASPLVTLIQAVSGILVYGGLTLLDVPWVRDYMNKIVIRLKSLRKT